MNVYANEARMMNMCECNLYIYEFSGPNLI